MSHVSSQTHVAHPVQFTGSPRLNSTSVAAMSVSAACQSYVTCYTSHVTRHTSHITRHTSHVTDLHCLPNQIHPTRLLIPAAIRLLPKTRIDIRAHVRADGQVMAAVGARGEGGGVTGRGTCELDVCTRAHPWACIHMDMYTQGHVYTSPERVHMRAKARARSQTRTHQCSKDKATRWDGKTHLHVTP